MALLPRDAHRMPETGFRRGDPERALKAYVRAKDWPRAALLAAELGDEQGLVRYSLLAAFGKLPAEDLGVLAAAELLAKHGHHEEAILLFESAKAFQRAGDSALALGQPARAAECFRQAGAWAHAAQCFEEAGRLRDAVQVIEEGVRRLQGRRGGMEAEELKMLQADYLIRLGRGASCLMVLRSLPPSSRVAELLERAGRFNEAVQCHLDLGRVEEASRVAERSPDRERLQAQIYLKTGQPVPAGDVLARLGMAHEAAEAYEAGQQWSHAGYRWEAAGEPRRAAEAYEKAGRMRDAARCFEGANLPERAAELQTRAPDQAKAAAIRAQGSRVVPAARKYLAAGDQVRAASILMQMQPSEPAYAEGAVLLAPLLLKEGFCKEALERLRHIPQDALPAGGAPSLAVQRDYWEGRALEDLESFEAARGCYRRVVEQEPAFLDAWQRLTAMGPATVAFAAPPEPLREIWPAAAGPAVGEVLAGRYELLAALGCGGMGRVYKARDLELGELVALKVIVTRAEGGSGDEARLLREVQICRRISHPNVVRVFDLGRFPGGLFVTMELIEGRGLDEVIARESPLPFARIRFILSEIASGLGEAHRQGVVHRDLKPANVILSDNGVKVLDFGIASMAGLGARLTRVGFIVGTPLYMAPDQILGHKLDGRSDLYSLGVLAYALVTGREPFDAADARSLALQHLEAAPPDVRELRAETPQDWMALLSRLLEKRQENRFQSAQELLEELARLPV